MGSQVALLGTTEDLLELLAEAGKLGAQAVPELIPLDDPPEVTGPVDAFRAGPGKRLYLLPGDLAPVEIFAVEVPDQPGTGKVDVMSSPVVELISPRTNDGIMRAGRFYLGLSRSDSLFRSAKVLYDALKKATEGWPRAKEYDVRVGPRAAEEAGHNRLALESNTGERLTLRGPEGG